MLGIIIIIVCIVSIIDAIKNFRKAIKTGKTIVTMDLAEIKNRKNALRQDIAEKISKFEQDTGVIVNQVWIDRIEGGITEPDIISVVLKIDLG